MDELQARVVARIRELAKASRLAVSHLPDHAGVSRSHFWEVMAGRKSPTLQWLDRIAVALSVDAVELLKPVGKVSRSGRRD